MSSGIHVFRTMNTAFREGEISIDGAPAGAAPVYQWIYTGGIDPFFWEPIPGVQALNFCPYRIDLTPFAGVLSNGQPHTIAPFTMRTITSRRPERYWYTSTTALSRSPGR